MLATSRRIALAAVFAALAAAPVAAAPGVPQTVSFTARITDGNMPAQGAIDVHIALFDAATAGTMVWEETQTLAAEKGLVYASLGTTTPLTPVVLDGRVLYAELTVEGDVLAPRIPVASVPYAIRAGVAAGLDGFDPTKLVTAVNAGTGLSGGGNQGAVSLSVDTTKIQARVTGSCPAGQYIRAIAADGTVTCQADASNAGDITSVAAGAGLAGGGTTGDLTLQVAAGGIVPSMIANGAVTTPALGIGAVTTATIAANAVTMSKLNVPIGYAELTTQGAFFIYPSGNVNLTELGSCLVSVTALDVGANAPFSLRPSMLNVASNVTIQQPQFAFTAFSSGAQSAGWQATTSAVLTTNATGNWRFGCEVQSVATPIVSCRVSWLCQ